MNSCKNCNKEVEGTRKYCTKSCRAIHINSIRSCTRKVPPVFRECLYCSKTIKTTLRQNRKFCNSECAGKMKTQTHKKVSLASFREGTLAYRRRIYDILCEEKGNKCSICGIEEWNNQPIRLWVDHVDGDPTNNSANNFRLICPNCESQTLTSRGRNRGNGRTSKGLKPYS